MQGYPQGYFQDQPGQSVGAQILAATAQRAAAGGPFDDQWATGVWQQAGLNPQQAAAAHAYVRNYQQQTGRQLSESDLNDVIGQVQTGGAPNAAGWRSQGGGQAQQQPYQPAVGYPQPSAGGWGSNPQPNAGGWSGYPQQPGYPGGGMVQGGPYRYGGGAASQWPGGVGEVQVGGNAMQYYDSQPGRMTTQVQNKTPGMSYGGQAQQPSVQNPQVPLAHQVNPMVWDSLGPVGQELARGAIAQTGQDVGQYEYDMNRARPQGYAGQAQPTARYRPLQRGYAGGF